ncbi:MAG TPA: monovalent cation/H+ antiporter complex subunit F [Roseomonas sp.]|nr:monovalent cation/H+ antiporter complex subunit F [Roseomonas sp.]
MSEFLLAAALFVFLTMLAGLVRVLRGPEVADRIMAAALLGTGGIAALLLAGVATGTPALADLALTLAVLAAFASVAMARTAPRSDGEDGEGS